MYRIIGSDGKEYGPVSAEQLRQWIREGRANATTPVFAEGSTEWKPLGSLAEFSMLIACSAPHATPAVFPSASYPSHQNNGFATASLVLGIASIFCCCCYGLPFNILALIFAIIALGQIRNNPDRHGGQGMAIAGLVLSILSLVLAFLFLIIGLMNAGENNVTHHVYKL
jgi:hypothetical protein